MFFARVGPPRTLIRKGLSAMNIYSPKLFCVYLTTYLGSKLPPFYIGSTSYSSILNGYRGTVTSKKYKTIWKNELIKNPHLFKTRVISFHENRTLAYEKEELLQRKLNVVRSSMYVNMAYANKRFIAEKGVKLPKQWCENISKAQIGRTHTTETKIKQSKAGGHRKGKTNKPEWNKKNSESNKLVIKTYEWNKKNSIAQSGRIMLANVITKQRKNLKMAEAEVLLNTFPNIWIKLSSRKPIPDIISPDESAFHTHEN